MTVNYELLSRMYPEWEIQGYPLLPLIKIFLAIALFLVVPSIYIKFIEGRLQTFSLKILRRISAMLPS